MGESPSVCPTLRSLHCLRPAPAPLGLVEAIKKRICHVVPLRLQLILVAELQGAPMPTADTYVRARIDTKTKDRAADALEAMGLSISDAIRLLMLRIADERRLPFEVKVPNATTRKAIAELESGKGKHFATVEALMADLHADD
jgi:DNA-damage-inducible protein J